MKKKLIIVIVIIILIVLSLSVWILRGDNNNSNIIDKDDYNIKYSEPTDFELILKLDDNSTRNTLKFNIKLINIRTYPIYVADHFHLCNGSLELIIKNVKNNKSFYYGSGDNHQYILRYIILNSLEYLSENVTISINSMILNYLNNYDLYAKNTEVSGTYIFQARYRNELFSNTIEYYIK